MKKGCSSRAVRLCLLHILFASGVSIPPSSSSRPQSHPLLLPLRSCNLSCTPAVSLLLASRVPSVFRRPRFSVPFFLFVTCVLVLACLLLCSCVLVFRVLWRVCVSYALFVFHRATVVRDVCLPIFSLLYVCVCVCLCLSLCVVKKKRVPARDYLRPLFCVGDARRCFYFALRYQHTFRLLPSTQPVSLPFPRGLYQPRRGSRDVRLFSASLPFDSTAPPVLTNSVSVSALPAARPPSCVSREAQAVTGWELKEELGSRAATAAVCMG